ncbi:MAG: translation initiation factor IF-3 [Kiritimatiellae bacterium]|nr:translation initiation factor IF-3 [Kiritimatiellia bacterium]MDD4342005.1 translation initiation factor IF-3 [Kiritimatiellia bacterium]
MNQRIRVPEVRLIGPTGEQLGVVSNYDAQTQARNVGLDLVEISPTARPPVCRIMDYGKYRYDQSKREKQNKRNTTATKVKEIQLHPSVGEHDYDVKLRRLKGFLAEGHRVKVALFFRGRENAHKDLGFVLMNQVLSDIQGVGVVEQAPKLMGRNIQMVLNPDPKARQAAKAAPDK